MTELQTVTNEDTVHALFFSSLSNSDSVYWETMCKEINLTLKTLATGYIWHRDEFKVCLPILNDENCALPMHLIASTCFGDNIEDEWFIVYLIMELSKKYSELIIQIIDNDGDFMLIEAADYLPKWANPETTENRVFIFKNEINLISPDLASFKNKLSVNDAIELLVKFPEKTRALPEIKNTIITRIGSYPEKIKENIQRVIVRLPLEIAAVLKLKPALIAPIVTTYCNHDIIDVKSVGNIDLSDYVYVEVNFTKCLYAMLMHSKLIRSVKHKISAEAKRDELGFKITFGFQMLMKTAAKDIFCSKEFIKYKNNLKENGYFRNNIEHSKEYNYLLEKAKNYFFEMECPVSTYVSNNVSSIMATGEFLKCKESLKEHNKTDSSLNEDNDDWLSIEPSQLNNMLNNRYGNSVKFNNDDIVTPETITTKLTDFLKQSSGFEGVDTKEKNDLESKNINFDANEFINCLEKMMDLVSVDMHSSSETDSDFEDNLTDAELDEELANKLKSYDVNRSDGNKVMFNLTQSIKEEGVSGPSSNLLSSIGINKTDLLDSDDD